MAEPTKIQGADEESRPGQYRMWQKLLKSRGQSRGATHEDTESCGIEGPDEGSAQGNTEFYRSYKDRGARLGEPPRAIHNVPGGAAQVNVEEG